MGHLFFLGHHRTVLIPGWTPVGIVFVLFCMLAAWAIKATVKLSKPEL